MRLRTRTAFAIVAVATLAMAPAACGDDGSGGGAGGGPAATGQGATTGDAGPGTSPRNDAAGSPQAAASRRVRAQRLAGFDEPVEVRFAPGFGNLAFVVEQTGRVRVMKGGRKLGRPFIDLSDRIDYGGERGLLSIGFPPDYRRSKRFYVYYTARDGDVTVDEFRRTSATRADPSSRRNVITIPHRQAENHNGGSLQFLGRLLFFGTGDGGAGQSGNAQDLGSLLGKLIRIDPRPGGGRPYTVPPSNPFVGREGRDEIYSYGLRNPFRFSIDERRGKPELTIADVGETRWEEVNHLTVGAARGANFGWDRMEGFSRYQGSPPPGAVRPVYVYGHGGGNCSITGGQVVGKGGPPALRGRYLFADFCGGRLQSIPATRSRVRRAKPVGVSIGSPSSFGADSRGRVYVTSLEGGLYRLR